MTQLTDMLKVQLGAAADSKSRTPFAPGGMFLAYVFASGSLTSLACVHNQTCSGPSPLCQDQVRHQGQQLLVELEG